MYLFACMNMNIFEILFVIQPHIIFNKLSSHIFSPSSTAQLVVSNVIVVSRPWFTLINSEVSSS